ncbi:MAG: alpha/beta hydrolase [Deltaproteobacteria bacterium]|nr:alpha/beta hydrolase [Deltaproteobacteria bacterium]
MTWTAASGNPIGMRERCERREGADGLPLAVYHFEPEDEPRGLLTIAHGMGEHAQRYRRLGERFTAAGWSVLAHDQRGHGKSLVPGAPLGHMGDEDSWRKAVDDLLGLIKHQAAEHPGLPQLLLGHSMGSFMVQQAIYEEPGCVDGVVLSASNGKPPLLAQAGRALARAERVRLGRRRPSALLNKMSFGKFNDSFEPARTPFDWLSRDEAEVDAYIEDPLCGFDISVQSWVDMLDALGQLARVSNQRRIPRDQPLFIFAGSRDPVGDFGAGVQRLAGSYRSAGLEAVELKLYEGGRHEMLNETNRDEVMDDVLAFAERVAQGRRDT